MPKLAHLMQGTQALQAKLAQKNVASRVNREDLDKALAGQVERSSSVLGDRIEGALNRLLDKNTKATAASLSKDIAGVLDLIQQSHEINQSRFSILQGQMVSGENKNRDLIEGVLSNMQDQSTATRQALTARLEQIAIDLGTVPRTTPDISIPAAERVDLSSLESMTGQLLEKMNTPDVQASKEHVFEIERDPFTDLITQVNVKEV